KLIEVKTDIAKKKYESAEAIYASTRSTMFAAAAGCIVLGLGLGYGLSLLIANPLRKILAVLEAVARGDLSKRADVGTTDEAGRGAPALNAAIAAMKKSADATAESLVNGGAMNKVMEATARATTPDDVARAALDAVRDAFGWAYGSFWRVDTKEQVLKFC